MIGKPVRHRSEAHLRFVRGFPCCVPGCKRSDVIAHHLTIAQPKGRSIKAGDQWTVPLCEGMHHAQAAPDGVHRDGDERRWWTKHGVDPLSLAQQLWAARGTKVAELL